mmetsp:Transcript_4450/g.7593  ORF Transcript_4450/g.7593 Transcript_4450/m.7593 type:complete len:291 (-) Transcript_4450:75-947(-)
MNPDPTLNFELGEVIYENTKVAEWVRFWKALTAIVCGASPAFYIFEIYAGDGVPSLQWVSENWFMYEIPRQFQDGSGWDTKGARYPDDHDYMSLQYGWKRTIGRSTHTFHIVALLTLMGYMDAGYVTKMTYNKEKDLVFIRRPNRLYFGDNETVHEVHHLEQMVPSAVTAIKNMSSLKKDGILVVYDMAQHDEIRFYQDEKYWNHELKEEFLGETRTLWEEMFDDKNSGRLFFGKGNIKGHLQFEYQKINEEMFDIAAEQGEIKLAGTHIADFYEKIEKTQRELGQISQK